MNPFAPKRLPRNILSGILGQACGLAIAFVTTPLLVRGLGVSDYGLWNVAMAVGAWVGFVNMMCATSAVRFVGQALGRRNTSEVSEASEALRRWSLVLGSLGCLILIVISPWLSQRVFHLEPAQRFWAPKVLMLQGLFVLFQVLAAVESGIVAANQRLDVTQTLRTAGAALQSGGAAAMVMISHGVVAVAWWVAMAQALEWLATGWWARRLKPQNSQKSADMAYWGRRLFAFGAPLATGYFAAQLFLPASRILLGTLRPVAEVSHFAVPLTLAINVKALSTHIAGALFPAMTEKAGQSDLPALKQLYLKGLKWSWLAVVPPAGLAMALGGAFISAWIGVEFGRDVGPVIPALVVGVNAYYFSSMPELVAQGMGRPGPWAVIIVICGLCNVAAASFLIPARGAVGAAEAMVIAGVLLTATLLFWMGRLLRVSASEYAEAFDWRVAVATAAVSLTVNRWVSGNPLSLGAVLGWSFAGLVAIGLAMPLWLPLEEKQWLAKQWPRKP